MSVLGRISFFLVLFTAVEVLFSQDKNTGKIGLKITNLRNPQGLLHISIYGSSSGFPSDPQTAVYTNSFIVSNHTMTIELPPLPYGEYAIAFFYDENGDSRMQKNGLGIPREGIAFSRNAHKTFRAPTFEEASFILEQPQQNMTIKMKYYL